jgi:hypothetical protein
MKFRTEVDIKESDKKIEIEDKIFSIGSCFASEMTDLFQQGQFRRSIILLELFLIPFQSIMPLKGYMMQDFMKKKN